MTNPNPVERALGQVEGKLDGLVTQVTALTERLDHKLNKTDERISALEKKQYWMTGVAMGLAFILTKVDFTKVLSIGASATHVAGL